MQNFRFIGLSLLVILSGTAPALAFSVEQPVGQNSDGSAKFTDPDEKMPAFMVSPDQNSTGNGALSFGTSTTTAPTIGDSDNGARAFDRAFSHQNDK